MVLITLVLTKYALINSFLKQNQITNFSFSILAFSIICITAGGYIINDILDMEADKINKPNHVFIDTNISKKKAWISYFLISGIGIILGIYLSFKIQQLLYSLLFIGTFVGLFIYSLYLKKSILIGNFTVSFFVALSIFTVFVFHSINDNSIYLIQTFNKSSETITLFFYVRAYTIFSFLTTLIREIIKDIEDINGDIKQNAKTLPIVFGRKRANKIALVFSVLLFLLLTIALKIYLINYPLFLGYTVLFVLLPLLYFIYKLKRATSKKDYTNLSKLMKLLMFFGIISMLFFKFI